VAGPYDAFLLVSLGSPEGPDDIMPFLENVTRGRGILPERLEAVTHHYLALDGVSPINGQNRRLVAALRVAFDGRDIDLSIYWGNRNWDPFLTLKLERIHGDGNRRVLEFATRPSLEAAGLVGRLGVDKIRHYFDHPGFIRPFAEGLVPALTELAGEGYAAGDVRVFFTTHSIPLVAAALSRR